MIDRLLVNLSNAGVLTRASLRTILVAYGDEKEVQMDLDCMTDEEDDQGRDVYDLAIAAARYGQCPPMPSGVWGDSPEISAAWDQWLTERKRVFWRSVRKLAGWPTPKAAR